MPISYRIDRDRRVVFTEGSGILTEEEVFEHHRRLRADPEFDPEFGQLADMRAVTEPALTTEGIRRIVRATTIRGHRAFVVASDLAFGISRMTQSYSDLEGSATVSVFRSMAEAFAWLGLDGDGSVASPRREPKERRPEDG